MSLAQALNFTPADLTANQNHQLSPAQVARVNTQATSGVLMLAVAGVMLLLGVVRLFTRGGDSFPALELILIGAASLIGYGGVWVIVQTGRDLSAKSVVSVSGIVHRQIMQIRFSSSYLIRINQVDFSVSHEVYEAFQEGHAYQVFYTPRTRVLLSAIELDTEKQ